MLLQKGQTAAAVESLAKTSALAPSEQCSLLLAQAYQNLGQYKEAIIEYKKLDIEQSKDKMISFNLGLCLLNTGNNIDAIEALKIAVQLDQSLIPAWGNIGTALMNEGRYQEALPATQKVLSLEPDNPTALMNLGVIYKDLGQPDQAIAATLKSLELKPDNPTALMNLGIVYKELGQLDQALSATLKSLELKPDNHIAHLNLGALYKEKGKLDEAVKYTIKSIELSSNNRDALINLGSIYNEQGKLDQAIACTLKSLSLDTENPLIQMNLGSLYIETGEFDQALDYTLKSMQLLPEETTLHLNMALIYRVQGKLDQALASTLKCIELKKNHTDAHMNLSLIYEAMGDMEKSDKSLQKALAIKPQLPEALFLLSSKLKDSDNANSLLQKIEETDQQGLSIKKQSRIEFAKANCYHILKEYKIASNSLKKANELKLGYMPSNAPLLIKRIQEVIHNLPTNAVAEEEKPCDHIFIVGLPRSGSTLLSAILNTNPLTIDLGESMALKNAIRAYLSQETIRKRQSLEYFYAEYIDEVLLPGCITIDKQLYNFMYCHQIASYMPGAKIIHATRNPLDNILSMQRANLAVGNNFTASVQESAIVLIEKERLVRSFKELFPRRIYTYSYDKLVNEPEAETRKILSWLGLDFRECYLEIHKNKQIINTASVMQARKPISNKSVGGWKKYSQLLEPARKMLIASNLFEIEIFNI